MTARATAVGVEVSFEKRFTDKWFGQGNVAFSRTRHAGLDGVLRPGSFDYPFAMNLVGGYRLSDRWELAGRVSYLAGRPYTPFDEATSSAQRRGVYDLDARQRGAGDGLPADRRSRGLHGHQGRQTPDRLRRRAEPARTGSNFADYSWDRVNSEVRYQEQQGAFPLIGMEWRF